MSIIRYFIPVASFFCILAILLTPATSVVVMKDNLAEIRLVASVNETLKMVFLKFTDDNHFNRPTLDIYANGKRMNLLVGDRKAGYSIPVSKLNADSGCIQLKATTEANLLCTVVATFVPSKDVPLSLTVQLDVDGFPTKARIIPVKADTPGIPTIQQILSDIDEINKVSVSITEDKYPHVIASSKDRNAFMKFLETIPSHIVLLTSTCGATTQSLSVNQPIGDFTKVNSYSVAFFLGFSRRELESKGIQLDCSEKDGGQLLVTLADEELTFIYPSLKIKTVRANPKPDDKKEEDKKPEPTKEKGDTKTTEPEKKDGNFEKKLQEEEKGKSSGSLMKVIVIIFVTLLAIVLIGLTALIIKRRQYKEKLIKAQMEQQTLISLLRSEGLKSEAN